MILKPASWSPLTALELARIADAAGLPKGLLSVLPGSGREIGNLLVEHPDIAKISFTGGTSTGRSLAEKAGCKLMPVSLELGGKSPTIVFDDADIEVALARIEKLDGGNFREENLKGALDGDENQDADAQSVTEDGEPFDQSKIDFQLARALDLIRGINVFESIKSPS